MPSYKLFLLTLLSPEKEGKILRNAGTNLIVNIMHSKELFYFENG